MRNSDNLTIPSWRERQIKIRTQANARNIYSIEEKKKERKKENN
jgi:hypothetical protein